MSSESFFVVKSEDLLTDLLFVSRFVRDSSKYWYKPTISRDEAVNLLRNAHPGTFIVRDSTTFANAFGLVLKVSLKSRASFTWRHF